MHLHNTELKERFKDFYFNFLPHMKNYTFTDSDNVEVTKDFEINFEEALNFYNQILVFIDVPKKKKLLYQSSLHLVVSYLPLDNTFQLVVVVNIC